MFTRSFLIFCAILCGGQAFAQQPPPAQTTYTFTFDGKQIDTIAKALGSLPFNEVAPLIQQLGRDIGEQNAARAAAARPAEPAK